MKTELLVALSLACTGCQISNPTQKNVSPAARVVLPVASVGLRVPDTIKTYAVGAYVDPDDGSVRHDAHLIHRLEKPARWNLAAPTSDSPSTVSVPVAPTPLPPPAPILTPILPSTPPISPTNTAAAPAIITPPAQPPSAPANAMTGIPQTALEPDRSVESILTPNADGVIDLAAPEQSLIDDDANPFAVRAQGPGAIREISLRVGGVFAGPSAGALVNDRPMLIGETVESFDLVRVESDAAVFRAGTRLLRVPVNAKPSFVRLAR